MFIYFKKMKHKLYNCFRINNIFLELINDFATEGYLFWDKSDPENLLLDSKLSSKLRIDKKQRSTVLNPFESEKYYNVFLQQIISKVLEKGEFENASAEIVDVHLSENLYNSKIYFSIHKDLKSESEYYLAAIQTSKFLENRSPLELLPSKLDLATWQCNVQTGELYINDYWAKLLGYSPQELEPLSFDTFATLTHPEDLVVVNKLLERYVTGESKEYRCELRMKHKKGYWIWLLSKGNSISTTLDGKVEWMMGSHLEISDIKLKEQESEALALVAKETDYSVLITSAAGITTFVNDSFTKMTGYSREDLFGKKPGNILQGELTSKVDVDLFRKKLEKRESFRQEIINYRKNGEQYEVSCFVNPVIDQNGKLIKYISLQREITEEKRNKNFLETFKNTLDQTEDCVFLFSRDTFQFFYINEAAIEMMGYSKQELLSLHPYDIKPEYPPQKFRKLANSLIKSEEKSKRFITIHQTKNGKNIPVEVFLQFIDYKTVNPYFVAIVQDISERLKNEETLKRLSLVAKNTTNLVVITDGKGAIEFVNEAFEKKTGYTLKELIGKKPGPFLHGPDTHPDHIEANRRGLKELQPFTQEILNYTKKGETYWVSITFNPVFNKSGELTNIIAIENDITERKELEFSLKKEKDFLQDVIGSQSLCIVILDKTGEITFANSGAENILGLEKNEIESRKYNDPQWRSITLEGDPFPEAEQPFVQVMNSKGPVKDIQHGIVLDNGEIKYLSISGAPFSYENGQISEVIFSVTDITQRINTQMQLGKVTTLLNEAQRLAKMGAWELDLSTNKTFWSDEVYNIHQVEKDFDHSKVNGIEFYHPDYRPIISKAITDAIENQIPFDIKCKFITAKNNLLWVRSSGYPVIENGKVIRLYGMFKDITQEEADKQAIIHEQLFSKQLLENMADGFSVVDLEGRQIGVNKAFCAMTGFLEHELIGQTAPYPYWPPEEIENINKAFKKTLTGELSSFELTFQKKNGQRFPILISTSLLKDENGNALNYFANIKDITKNKEDENAIQEYISIVEGQNERLKNFTFIVSHNLRSHSSNIHGILDVIKLKEPELVENRFIQLLNKASNKLEDTLLHLNNVVSVVSSKQEMKTVKLSPFIDDFQSSFQTMIEKASVNFINEVEEDTYIEVVPAFLDSIITNLITNAIRYRDPEKESFVKIFSQKDKNYTMIGVEDNGLGLDLVKYGNKLFGMNKTFHNNKNAKGIGLFLTKNQIESMGGKIEVDSKPKKGSTFKVYFKNGEI